MFIKCIENPNQYKNITIGKIYIAEDNKKSGLPELYENCYYISDDVGDWRIIPGYMFLPLDKYRENIIDDILE